MDYKNNNMKKGKQSLQEITLSHIEKDAMLTRLKIHMDNNPIHKRHVSSPWYTYMHVLKQHASMSIAVLLICVFVIGGNITYAAEQSLPGDILYPIKLHVTEKVQDVIHFGSKSRVAWEETKVTRRIKEAEALIENGTFDEIKRVAIEKQVGKSAANMSKEHIEDSDHIKNTYIDFTNQLKKRKSQATDVYNNGTNIPRVVISTSTLKDIQKIKHATTTGDVVVQLKIEHQDIKKENSVHDVDIEKIEGEVQKFEEHIQKTFHIPKDILKK